MSEPANLLFLGGRAPDPNHHGQRMAKAPFNLTHPGAAVTLARYFAKRAVKDEWRKAGLKPQYLDASELTKAATAYLNDHPCLLDEAERTLAEWESSPRYRSFVESSPMAQHRKPRKPTP
jgi:hypothetical protein